MNTSLIITIADALLGLWSVIGGIIGENKRVNETINKAINKAKNKVSGKNWLNTPIFITNTEILQNVLLRAKNEPITITDSFTKDVFNDIYKELINNKEFWEILQELLTENRLQLLNCRTEDIIHTTKATQDKIDEIIIQINNLVISIEKAKLSENRLVPYYPLSIELFITEEENKKLYRDKSLVDKIHQNLDSKQVCLIQGSEGRGKTTICRIIASDYYSDQFKVYFIDVKSDIKIGSIKNCFIELNATKRNTLVVLENIHAFDDLGELVGLINNYRTYQENHLFFLLNARPTESEYASELEDLGKDNNIDLKPSIKYCKEVAQHICNKNKPISSKDVDLFITSRIYSNSNGTGINLRLLSLYYSVWNEGDYNSILNIQEQDILDRFKRIYRLRNRTSQSKNGLLYLSCIYQFDTPLSESLLTDEIKDSLQQFVQDGLSTLFNHNYYLPHSVEAALLCKAICDDNQYIEKTMEFVETYITAILRSDNPQKYETEFKLLSHGIIGRKDEFQLLFFKFCNWPMAEKIIKNINPGFVVVSLHHNAGHSKEDVLKYYKANINWLKVIMLKLHPGILDMLALRFSNHFGLNYIDFYRSIFNTPDDLQQYFQNQISSDNNGRLRFHIQSERAIKALGKDYASIYKDFVKREPLYGRIPNYSYIFRFTSVNAPSSFCVTPKFTRGYWLNSNFEFKKLEKGFHFKNITWLALCRFLKSIYYNITDEDLCKQIIENIIQIVLMQPESFSYAPSKLLSLFFDFIALINKESYVKLLDNKEVIKEVKYRLIVKNYSLYEIWLFSHFYNKKWFDVDLTKIVTMSRESLDKADEKDLSTMLRSIYEVNADFYKIFTTNKTVVDMAKHRLDMLLFKPDNLYDNLYLFGRFYSFDWCKDKMNKLIDNTNEKQQKILKDWHDKVKRGLDMGGKTIEKDSLWSYIHDRFYIVSPKRD